MILSRRVRALPEPQVRDDRAGLRVAARRCSRSSTAILKTSATTAPSGSCASSREHVLPRVGHRVLPAELLGRREPSRAAPTSRPRVGTCSASTGSCGAATTPTTRAPTRSRASTCARSFHDWSEPDLQQVLAGNAAELYDFDLDALAPHRGRGRPDRRRDRHPARRAAARRQRGAPPQRPRRRRRLTPGVALRLLELLPLELVLHDLAGLGVGQRVAELDVGGHLEAARAPRRDPLLHLGRRSARAPGRSTTNALTSWPERRGGRRRSRPRRRCRGARRAGARSRSGRCSRRRAGSGRACGSRGTARRRRCGRSRRCGTSGPRPNTAAVASGLSQ